MAQTQIQQRQIADSAINDAKIAAGANIATSKLADGANFLKRDGSVVLTGNLDANSNKITNLANPSANGDAVNLSYLNTQLSNLNSLFDAKGSVKVATTVAGTLASSFINGSSIDGVTLSTGDLILIKDQIAAEENGIYTIKASGAPDRIAQMDTWAEVPGAFVAVEQGIVNEDTIWLCTSNAGGTINITAITWQQIPTTAGLTGGNFVDKEVPTGAINGANTAFTLANSPVASSEHVYLNGILQESGAGNDYTISGVNITMLTAPLTGEKLRVTYRK